MPELMPVFEQVLSVIGPDDLLARFLTLYSPTPIVRGCSQLVFEDQEGPVLVRNYDHAPSLCDGVVLATRWGGVGVHVMTDCLWGALDGVNEHGLVVALAFGGEKAVGPGFAASLVVRYLLQTCKTVSEAKRALTRLPVYMSYSFTMLDRAGDRCTAYVSPKRAADFVDEAIATNHQRRVRWPEYAKFAGSLERRAALDTVAKSKPSYAEVIESFMSPPLFRDAYGRGSGTLYTAAYDPSSMAIDLFWSRRRFTVEPWKTPAQSILVGYHTPPTFSS